ncbi:MAG: LytTR family DNA-binding domain-containing protein [Lentihominibacter sp.]
MNVEVKLDSTVNEIKVIIITDKLSEEVDEIVQKLSDTKPQMVAGFSDDTVTVLNPDDIVRIYAANGKVYAVAGSEEYVLRLRLYELEERLKHNSFVRISNSEIINLKKVKNFDLSFAGTICVILINGESTFVSRRYVSKIKGVLGI